MRGVARWLLFLLAFTIPWEYSLDLGAPWGNIARLCGLAVLPVAALAVGEAGAMRRPGTLHWLAGALFLWFCCSCFWSIAPRFAAMKLPGYCQEMMLVWLTWELLDGPEDLRSLLRAWLAGSWVLALLTLANFVMRDPGASDQIRFVAAGQDPNDVARFIALAMPIAALLLDGQEKWLGRLLAAAYIPVAFGCVLLTGSRSGFVIALVALAGCGLILFQRNRRSLLAGSFLLSVLAGLVWAFAPHETLLRLATISEQLQNADLNQRFNIWSSGWRAFVAAPLCGYGAGSFVTAAGLAPEDTAHNTTLSILVEGGLIALALAGAIVLQSLREVVRVMGPLRVALFAILAAWFISSLAGTVGESRTTWLLLATIALTGRFAGESPDELVSTFPQPPGFETIRSAAASS